MALEPNHAPLWLEANDRRYFIVDIDHQGHASGPLTEEFQGVVQRVQQQIEDPGQLEAETRADNKRDDWEAAGYGVDFIML